ncbi:pyrroline-5-carboxylate reductase [Corynebacterium appendicis CIP 107643]|uniref:Pyrroline-5-carboxylate reductase n=1 Tax=Corynebacterium appendicis CIP 107643 TaxID=1161099 RepID=A0A1N7IN07_9CORY|nr:pyrroline-5-carboxylate reductase [Corynebacterium appendicis]MCT1684762.1 pyrroline-5-carboxylate reductase [Corynebacterium appendicis]WJY60173.1 Pyrroline-5-carboxylate reductase [Corynebacterium appendicis CIP 107643]SIS38386.1 pyrroline-5-carboxylate reductase [Corynebacterium appendicis CIP 107643]
MSTTIAVIGAGNIGEALISGLVNSGVNPETITATNRTEARRAELAQRYGVITTDDNIEAVTDADVCFLCVKPYAIADMIEELSDAVAANDTSTVLVSMAAGVTLDAMSEAVSSAGTPLARVMPNTPMQVGKGVCVVSFGRFVEEDQQELVTDLLGATGQVVVVPEKLIDAASAISGSGPAYFFMIAEALVDSGVSLGLPRDTATALATATAEGAGAMLAHSGKTPVELRAGVSSPAGTTVAAIRELEESGVRGAFYRATEAAASRAAEMGT